VVNTQLNKYTEQWQLKFEFKLLKEKSQNSNFILICLACRMSPVDRGHKPAVCDAGSPVSVPHIDVDRHQNSHDTFHIPTQQILRDIALSQFRQHVDAMLIFVSRSLSGTELTHGVMDNGPQCPCPLQ